MESHNSQKNIPFVDLKAQMATIRPAIDKAISTVLEHGKFILGPEVEQFEKEFAKYIGVKHCIGVNDGTMALVLSLRAAGIKPGDSVLVPGNTYIATALAASACGAKLVMCDPDPDTFNLSAASVERELSRDKTIKAVMPVHLYGQPVDIEEICTVASKHGAVVVEDACQAHGAKYKGKRVGGFGIAGAFSFYPGKNLGAYGDGGAVTTNDDKVAACVRAMRDYGQSKKYHHETKGGNHRLDTLQAGILLAKLPHLDSWNARRVEHAKQYDNELKGVAQVKTPVHAPNRDHIYHLYVIECEKRDELAKFLGENGVSTGIHYPIPIHCQNAYPELHQYKGKLVVCERQAGRILSLPMFAELSVADVSYVCDKIKEFYSS